MKPVLYIVVPCYNEEAVLPITHKLFGKKIAELVLSEKISDQSRVLFVDDGSIDGTWDIISKISKENPVYTGISLSRNRGHQNALLAGLYEVAEKCDISVSIDCDGQDDINAVDQMIEKYLDGNDIVYGVRRRRDSDTFFKRNTAKFFYKFMHLMGAETVYNHADYRLLSSRVLKELYKYKEVNLYLRGTIPLIGFKSDTVYYDRTTRLAGETHYPLYKMLSLAIEGITGVSVRPLRLIFGLGVTVGTVSVILLILALVMYLLGHSLGILFTAVSVIALLSGIQLIALGTIGEYVGKIYLETKARPRFIVKERTEDNFSK